MLSMEEYFELHSMERQRPLEVLHWDVLQRLKSLLEWAMATTVNPELDIDVMVGRH